MKQQAVRVAAVASHWKRRENSVPQALLNDAPRPQSLPHFSSCQYPSERLVGSLSVLHKRRRICLIPLYRQDNGGDELDVGIYWIYFGINVFVIFPLPRSPYM